MKYIIEQLNETSYLANFKCGVSIMDTFIQDGLDHAKCQIPIKEL